MSTIDRQGQMELNIGKAFINTRRVTVIYVPTKAFRDGISVLFNDLFSHKTNKQISMHGWVPFWFPWLHHLSVGNAHHQRKTC